MRRIRFKARALHSGKTVEGYYAHMHLANFDADGSHIISYDEQDGIFNDEPGNRNGSCWTRIDGDTLCQETGMDDMFMMPIWEHDIVRLYSIREKHFKHSDPLHEQTGEVEFLQTAFAIRFEDGSNHTMSYIRRHYDLQVVGNAFDL
jgi:hypothetical protein